MDNRMTKTKTVCWVGGISAALCMTAGVFGAIRLGSDAATNAAPLPHEAEVDPSSILLENRLAVPDSQLARDIDLLSGLHLPSSDAEVKEFQQVAGGKDLTACHRWLYKERSELWPVAGDKLAPGDSDHLDQVCAAEEEKLARLCTAAVARGLSVTCYSNTSGPLAGIPNGEETAPHHSLGMAMAAPFGCLALLLAGAFYLVRRLTRPNSKG